MTGRDPLRVLQDQWRQATPEGALGPVRPRDLERRAQRLAKQVVWRNVREWSAVALVVVVFAAWALSADRWLTQLGAVWMTLAALFIAGVLLFRGRNLPAPPLDAPTSQFLAHQRAQLERQAVLLEHVPTWYALPLATGMTLILIDRARELLERSAPSVAFAAFGLTVVVVLAVYLAVLVLNRRAARALRARAARLSED